MTNKMLDAALAYAREGMAVFPCIPFDKKPFGGGAGSKDATTDEKKITEWWTRNPTANIAIATGRASGIHVVDIDAPNSDVFEKLPPTRLVRTARGGFHAYFLYPDDLDVEDLPNSSKGALDPLHPDCDTRGRGGYVLAPPSVFLDPDTGVTGHYTWHNKNDPAVLPSWIVEKLRPPAVTLAPRAMFAMVSTTWADRALRDECDAVANTAEGGRNHRLNVAAFNLGQVVAGGHLSAALVEGELERAGLACGLGEREVQKTVRSGMNGGMKHPRSPKQQLARFAPDPFDGAEITDGSEVEALAPLPAAPVKDDHEADQKRWALVNAVRSLGGLCDSYLAWVVRGADHAQPGLALASLLALGSVMAGRRLVYRRATSSLYVVAVAPTAEGKNRPQQCLQRVVDEVWPTLAGGNSFSSAPAFVDTVRRAEAAGTGSLFVLDEYGMQLEALLGPRAATHRLELKQFLTELATKSTDKWSPAISLAKGGGKLDIWAPVVTVLGSTTPTSLHKVLTSTEVADGFAGRHLWFRAQDVLPMWQPPEDRGDDGIPVDVRAAVSAIKARHEAWHMGLTAMEHGLDLLRLYDPQTVRETPEAAALLTEYKLACDEARRRNERPDIPRGTLGRAPEYAGRVALVLAALAQPEREVPEVTEAEAAVAIAIADDSAQTFADSLAENRKADWDDPAGQIEMVKGAVRRGGGSVVRTKLLRQCQSLTSRQLDDALARLVEEGRIVKVIEPTGGRPREVYRLTDD